MGLPRFIKFAKKQQQYLLPSKLADWFETPLGIAVKQAEADIANHIVPKCFGYHSLYCGLGNPDKLLELSPINHKLVVADAPLNSSWLPFLYGDTNALPLVKESVDLVVLQHSLDFEKHPHQVLREASATLIPGGTLIVIGFNPHSFWWIWRMLCRQTKEAPWAARFISPTRLSEWLSLLELEVEGCETGYYLPPWDGVAQGDKFNQFKQVAKRFFTKNGAVYVMIAKKKVSCVTPIAPKLRIGRRRFLNNPVANRQGIK